MFETTVSHRSLRRRLNARYSGPDGHGGEQRRNWEGEMPPDLAEALSSFLNDYASRSSQYSGLPEDLRSQVSGVIRRDQAEDETMRRASLRGQARQAQELFEQMTSGAQGRIDAGLAGRQQDIAGYQRDALGRADQWLNSVGGDIGKYQREIENQSNRYLRHYYANAQAQNADQASRNISAILNRAGGQGVMNSSVTGKALGDTGAEAQRQIGQTTRQGAMGAAQAMQGALNTGFGAQQAARQAQGGWGQQALGNAFGQSQQALGTNAQQNLQNLLTQFQGGQQMLGTTTGLLNAARYGQASDVNYQVPWGILGFGG